MIEINLLPAELRAGREKTKFPFQKYFTIAFIVLFGLWLAIILELQVIRLEVSRTNKSWQGMQVTYGDAKKIVDTIDNVYKPTLENFNKYVRRRMMWAPALNIISDDLPDNVWLSMLKMEDTSQLWVLTLRGAARPFRQIPSIRVIGDYAKGLEDEFLLIEKSADSPVKIEEKTPSPDVEVVTTTKRKVAGQVEITEFLTIFTRRRA
ncbi:MAG: hypothetical protein PHE61_01605 [Candidatus Omnitrophica bacterium]|nr:hypothetical protein [Candidatus Omnitrophota bacterium]